MDSLHRDRHKVTKKVAAAPCTETALAKKLKKITETCFMAHYYACLNRLRIDGDNRYSTKTAIMGKLVIAMYSA